MNRTIVIDWSRENNWKQAGTPHVSADASLGEPPCGLVFSGYGHQGDGGARQEPTEPQPYASELYRYRSGVLSYQGRPSTNPPSWSLLAKN